MHCPKCGNESDLDQKFCRKCGFNLAPVTELFRPGADDEPKLTKLERDKLIMGRMVNWMIWGLLVLVLGVVVTIVNKQFQLDQFVGLLGSLIILCGVSITMYGVLDTMRGGQFKKRKPEEMT